jgi:serine/threonine-protein kinase
MPARITLTITSGPLDGKQLTFDERTTAVLGRHRDCQIRFPKEYGTVSRHHCLIDLNPPNARIRDLGSRCGTYVNTQLIGRRAAGVDRKRARDLASDEVDLKDGDVVKIGKALVRVSVHRPCVCAGCGTEIPSKQQDEARKKFGVFYCEGCLHFATASTPASDDGRAAVACARCGGIIVGKAEPMPAGDAICDSCRVDSGQIVRILLDQANSGEKELAALQGFQFNKELGRGGMGAVYLIQEPASRRKIAIKLMQSQITTSNRVRELFVREAAITRVLEHRNVVRLFDLGCWRGTFFFTLEYCKGGSVADLLRKRGQPLSVAKATALILQALQGLEYAHQVPLPAMKLGDGNSAAGKGLVHRDIKPHNLFLAKEGEEVVTKIGDYGLAKAFDLAGMSGLSATGAAAGTPVFMPRQQLIDYKYAKPPVDVWAMAASLYYMLTLKYPRDFDKGKDPWQVVLQTSAIPIRKRNASIPAKLAEVIDAALVDDPEIGFKTAVALRTALEAAVKRA